jgi:lysozyme
MEITELDAAGLNLIKEFEGCILQPYLEQVGIPTIGYGQIY